MIENNLSQRARLDPSEEKSSLFPANLVLEGHDQHQRWFLCSLVSSVASTKKAPYLQLKTHGLVLDDKMNKMSKMESTEGLLDPEDLIYGSHKLDGERKFGYGIDVMRMWAATNDSDCDFKVSQYQLDDCNTQIKTFRQVLRHLLGNLHDFDLATDRVKFDQLTPSDKHFYLEIVQFLAS